MKLVHDKTEYVFTDSKSGNDAILIGYLTAGIDNSIKKLLQKQKRTVKVITIEEVSENDLSTSFDGITTMFDWTLCENLFLLKAYELFTPKMKRIFDNFYLQDKPVADIAALETCTQRAVNRILERCREYILLEKYKEEKRNAGRDNN